MRAGQRSAQHTQLERAGEGRQGRSERKTDKERERKGAQRLLLGEGPLGGHRRDLGGLLRALEQHHHFIPH